jgi:hypothetical protein
LRASLNILVQIGFTSIHELLGLMGVLSLLVLGTVAAFTGGIRLLGVGSMVDAVIVPVFGLTQSMILAGNLHWLFRTAHLLIGIGAMALAQMIDKRYRHLRKAASRVASASNDDVSSHAIPARPRAAER